MFCAECSQYRDEFWESGTWGSRLEESGQGPGIRQRGYSRWCKVLDKFVNGDRFGRRRGYERARLRRGFTPSKGGEGGGVCPGTGTVVRVVAHRRLLRCHRRCSSGWMSADETEAEREINISTLGVLFLPSTTMHSDAFDVIPFEVLHKSPK